ncbi:MAG: hypothetical protein R2838_20395, partial [Caldilineaceae bacterium]
MQITDVRLIRVSGTYAGPTFPDGDRQARALDIYPEFNTTAPRPVRTPQTGQALAALYVQIDTDEGISGFWGPIEEWQTQIIWTTLGPFLLGRDPLASELLFDQMARLDRHGRSGYFMTAVSAIDCALWDLKGKALGQPV